MTRLYYTQREVDIISSDSKPISDVTNDTDTEFTPHPIVQQENNGGPIDGSRSSLLKDMRLSTINYVILTRNMEHRQSCGCPYMTVAIRGPSS